MEKYRKGEWVPGEGSVVCRQWREEWSEVQE